MPETRTSSRCSQPIAVLKDSTNANQSRHDVPTETKKRMLDTFLKDFDSQVVVREKKLKKTIEEFSKSILSSYHTLIQQIPKKYQDMKLNDYIDLVGSGGVDKSVDSDIQKLLCDIIPTKSIKQPKKKKPKLNLQKEDSEEDVSDYSDDKENSRDGDYSPYDYGRGNKSKIKKSPRDYPHVDRLYIKQSKRLNDTPAMTKVLRSSTKSHKAASVSIKSESITTTKKSSQSQHGGTGKSAAKTKLTAASTSKKRNNKSSSVSGSKSSKQPATPFYTVAINKSQLSVSSSCTTDRPRRACANQTNSSIAKVYARVEPKRGNPVVHVAGDKLTLIVPLKNGKAITVSEDVNFEELPILDSECRKKLKTFLTKFSILL